VTDRPQPNPPTDGEAEGADFAALADAPLAALGLCSSAAEALKQALGVKTVRDLAANKYVRRAQAIVHMASGKR
jgi:hypothetical protein